MSKDKYYVKSNGRTYQWVDMEELKRNELVDEMEKEAQHADAGKIVSLLAFAIFIISAMSAALFAGIVRTVALKANPSISAVWLGDELQALMLVAVAWLYVTHLIILIVGIKCAKVLANTEQ